LLIRVTERSASEVAADRYRITSHTRRADQRRPTRRSAPADRGSAPIPDDIEPFFRHPPDGLLREGIMRKQKLVMVGNGMAGVKTLEELLKYAPDQYEITVFGAEPHGNYNRILLSPVLAGEMGLPDIMLNDLAWYADNGITLHTGRKIVEVDRVRRIVRADDGTEAHYDRLLLATGSKPFILPVPGAELPGVIAYRDIADTEAMINAARS